MIKTLVFKQLTITSIVIVAVIFLSCVDLPAKPPSNGNSNHLALEVISTSRDSAIFNSIVSKLDNYADKDFSDLIINIAQLFLGTPYVASTLEADSTEKLIINLREMDCTTFVEYATAMALTVDAGSADFKHFANNLATIRYRHGIMNGYLSRLHYFTEWISDNKNKGLLRVVSDSIGNMALDTNVYFMSKNSHLYAQLKNNSAYVDSIKIIEQNIADYDFKYILKQEIENVSTSINNGDIIAFVTNIGGLDVSHVGFAYQKPGGLFLLHASTRSKTVEISPVKLSDYLLGNSRVTGIIVVRLQKSGKAAH